MGLLTHSHPFLPIGIGLPTPANGLLLLLALPILFENLVADLDALLADEGMLARYHRRYFSAVLAAEGAGDAFQQELLGSHWNDPLYPVIARPVLSYRHPLRPGLRTCHRYKGYTSRYGICGRSA